MFTLRSLLAVIAFGSNYFLVQAVDTCYISECGCPGAYLHDWCESSETVVQSDWCQQQENWCTGECGGNWCADGVNPTPTIAPVENEGACYNSQCGCPGSFLQSWCTESGAELSSEWCSVEANCPNCGGTWCGDGVNPTPTIAPVEDEGACYNSQCGCPGSFLQSWCTESGAELSSEWCSVEANCPNCGGTWCPGGSSVPVPVPAPTAMPVVPSTGGGGGSHTCFSGDDKVTLESGAHVKFHKLKIGDSVLSANRDGITSYSKVVFLPHGENDTPTKFLQVETESKKTVKMTAGHLVQVCSGKLVGAYLLKAGNTENEDDHNCLRTVNGDERIVSIKQVTGKGVYTAVTENEFLVVNGIIASPFASSAILAHAYFNLTDMEDWCSSHSWLDYDKKHHGLDTLRQYGGVGAQPSEDCMSLLSNMFEQFKDEPIGWGVAGWGYRGWDNPSSRSKGQKLRDDKKLASRSLRASKNLKQLPVPGILAGWS